MGRNWLIRAGMVVVAGTCLIAATETGLSAQPARVAPVLRARGADQTPAAVPVPLDERAQDVKNELRQILEQYPPALGRVLKLDPTLMTSEAYLKPYPVLAAFLQVHPDVPHYSNFFLDFVDVGDNWHDTTPRQAGIELARDVFTGCAVLVGFLIAALTLTWLVRYIVGHRRWLRATKVQTEVHGRLLERLSSNEDLLAYVQSPVGSQFLKGLPSAPDANAMTTAPLARILWSVQAGLVLASAGVGLVIVRLTRSMDPDLASLLLVMGVLVISVGVGFLLAGASSYILSRQLGLLEAPGRRADA